MALIAIAAAITISPGSAPQVSAKESRARDGVSRPISSAVDINNKGQVVAYRSFTGGQEYGFWLWDLGVWVDLGVAWDGVASSAERRLINDRGQILLNGFRDHSAASRALVWERGRVTAIGARGQDDPGPSSRGAALNERGQIIGAMVVGGESHTFLWDNGQLIDVPQATGLGRDTVAWDLNNRGQILLTDGSRQYVWDRRSLAEVRGIVAFDLNDYGHLLGVNDFSVCFPAPQDSENCRLVVQQRDRLADLGGGVIPRFFSNRGHAVGELVYNQPFKLEALFIDRGTRWVLGALHDGNWTDVQAVNERGQVVGQSGFGDRVEAVHAFLWEAGRMTDLGTLGGEFSVAVDINERGQIIGVSTTAAGEYHAFMWQDGVMIDLEDGTFRSTAGGR